MVVKMNYKMAKSSVGRKNSKRTYNKKICTNNSGEKKSINIGIKDIEFPPGSEEYIQKRIEEEMSIIEHQKYMHSESQRKQKYVWGEFYDCLYDYFFPMDSDLLEIRLQDTMKICSNEIATDLEFMIGDIIIRILADRKKKGQVQ